MMDTSMMMHTIVTDAFHLPRSQSRAETELLGILARPFPSSPLYVEPYSQPLCDGFSHCACLASSSRLMFLLVAEMGREAS